MVRTSLGLGKGSEERGYVSPHDGGNSPMSIILVLIVLAVSARI